MSGVLNAQRIEQSFTQLQIFIKNYREFLHRKYMLRMAYWREYYTEEKVIKIERGTMENKESEFTTINQPVPETIFESTPVIKIADTYCGVRRAVGIDPGFVGDLIVLE